MATARRPLKAAPRAPQQSGGSPPKAPPSRRWAQSLWRQGWEAGGQQTKLERARLGRAQEPAPPQRLARTAAVRRNFLRQLLHCELLVPLLLDQICAMGIIKVSGECTDKRGSTSRRLTHGVLLELIPPLGLDQPLPQHLLEPAITQCGAVNITPLQWRCPKPRSAHGDALPATTHRSYSPVSTSFIWIASFNFLSVGAASAIRLQCGTIWRR